jgi:two-component system OmpR family response regulator
MNNDIAYQAGDVLIVDDDPTIVELIAEFLTEEGYPVRTASNGLEGWYQIVLAPPAVLLLDMMMPIMNGPELAVRVRTANYTFPIVAIAATPQLAEPLLALEGTMFIEKPFDLGVLLTVVRENVAVEVGVA